MNESRLYEALKMHENKKELWLLSGKTCNRIHITAYGISVYFDRNDFYELIKKQINNDDRRLIALGCEVDKS